MRDLKLDRSNSEMDITVTVGDLLDANDCVESLKRDLDYVTKIVLANAISKEVEAIRAKWCLPKKP